MTGVMSRDVKTRSAYLQPLASLHSRPCVVQRVVFVMRERTTRLLNNNMKLFRNESMKSVLNVSELFAVAAE
jgi:hypothetical protein